MIIQAYKNSIPEMTEEEQKDFEENKKIKNDDIYVIRKREEEKILEDGTRQIKVIKERVNLTKKINATAEIIKNENARAKLEELADKIAESIKNS